MTDIFSFGTSLLASSDEAGAAVEGAAKHAATSWLGWFLYTLFVLAIIFFLLGKAKKGINNRVFTNWYTQRFEQLYLYIENLCVGIIGPHGRKYMPMMMTLWLVIFFSNLVSLFMPYAPSADLSFNLGMALMAVGYVQYEGIRTNGLFGHLSHFAGPKMAGIMVIINVLIFAIEIVSELMKNISLSLRLFGNIHGGHEAVTALNNLSTNWPMPFNYVTVGFLLLPLKFLTCIVQALVFTLLTCVYLSLVTHHEEHGPSTEAAPAH